MTTPNTYADAAALAAWGLEVFPLKGKAPRTRHGHKDATTNQSQIEAWWKRWPTANIGARPAENMVVLDIDPRNGGNATWNRLNQGKELPTTLITRTGSGGLHIWFQLPYTAPVAKTAGDGIDLKTHRGYLVMPGSTHPTTGDLYTAQSWHDPNHLPTLPQHLHRHVFRPPAAPRRVIPHALTKTGDLATRLINDVATAPSGARNDALNRAAWIAYKNDLDISEELACAAACTGLPENEILRTIDSARRAAQAEAA
ncbi:bifunctional DNA primase/polymerase [Corynebacterium macclintockiae]|uniref:DNA primase n=1 Tax=Corynebacterium urealyticum TaxID=43771 RepID=A0A2W5B7Y1_9CORY|nr:MAG: DNA primase [Corynebacterium urealyticum]